MEPKHRAVVWRKATESLADLRRQMTEAGLKPDHVEGAIVYIQRDSPDTPRMLDMGRAGEDSSRTEAEALAILGGDDVLALGMIFTQFDWDTRQLAYFPLLFTGLNARGMAVLRAAAEDRRGINEDILRFLKNGS